jgi:hypothetical protein
MVQRLRDSFLQWLGPSLDTYFSTVYRRHHDIHKPAPSLVFKPQPQLGGKGYVKVHPEVIWDLMEEAQSSSASVAQVLRIRRRAWRAPHQFHRGPSDPLEKGGHGVGVVVLGGAGCGTWRPSVDLRDEDNPAVRSGAVFIKASSSRSQQVFVTCSLRHRLRHVTIDQVVAMT